MVSRQLYSLIFGFLCINFALISNAYSQYKGPSQDPVLRAETGMHTASVREISVDGRCSQVVTVSNDKTIRLWSLPNLRLKQVFRVPIGKGHEGKLYAVALSPDGRYVAAGGWDAQYGVDNKMRIYLFNTRTGRIDRRLGSFSSTIYSLTFSKDGRYLAAGLGGNLGVRVWRTRDWRQVGKYTKFKGDSYGVAFGPDNSLYTTSFGGYVRKFTGPRFKLAKEIKTRNGRESFSIAVNPSGTKVAVGYHRSKWVDVYNTSNLSYSFSPDVKDVRTSLITVAWSEDGRRLYAGGTHWSHKLQSRPMRIWGNGGRGKPRDVPLGRDTVMGIEPCGDNIVVGSADPFLSVLSRNGRIKISSRASEIADMYGKRGQFFTISRDGTKVRFGLKYQGRQPVLFDINQSRLTDAPRAVSGLFKNKFKGLDITGWDSTFKPKYRNKILKMEQQEQSRELSVLPDRHGFILGADWSLRHYDINGTMKWKVQAPGTTGGINVTRNGLVLVSSFNDGTIRWYRVSDGKELLTFFVNAKTRNWVVWTPKGYYMASPGGEDLVGWHINQSWNEPADFFPSSRFRSRFYRPDIVKNVLKFLDEDDAIAEANRVSKRRQEREDLRKRLPPVINIIYPSDNSSYSQEEVELEYSLRSPSGLKIRKVDILLDGRPIDSSKLISNNVPSINGIGRARMKLPSRNVKLSVIAHTNKAASEAASLNLQWGGQQPRISSDDLDKPKLYALLIGVSDYKNPDFKLRYAAKDARDMEEALKRQEGGVYREVVTKTLTDKQATAGNIRDALDWLEQEVTSRDVGLLFLAGHGITDLKQRFYYLPYDGNPEKLRRTAIQQADIQGVISSLAGKALMFIDACHSAGSFGSGTQTRGLSLVDVNGIVNELSSAENGVVMFASSTGRELSIEDERWENGAFTEALLEGLAGKADYNRNTAISIKELDLWLSERVKELTGKRQHPVARRPPTVPDFPIALAK